MLADLRTSDALSIASLAPERLAALALKHGWKAPLLPPVAGGAAATLAPEGYSAVPGVAPGTVPFDQASHSVFEEGPSWTKVELTAAEQVLEQKAVPANGFLRNLYVEVITETEGNETAGVAKEDFPHCIIAKLAFQDQGGHTISSLTGRNWYYANKYGGYFGLPDLALLNSFSKVLKKPRFTLVVPCEIAPTGFGALTNMTEATKYQLQPTIAQESEIYSTKMTTNPKFKIQTWCELWPLPRAMTDPEPGFPNGRPQLTRPPLEGTIQFWNEQSGIKVVAGENELKFSRVGQMVRTHVLVTKASGARNNEVLPEPTQFLWARIIFRVASRQRLQDDAQRYLANSTAIETGVYPIIYSYGQGRNSGENGVNSWLPTVNSTRMELKGTFKEGEVTILTNDVAVAPVAEVARREVPGGASPRNEPLGTE